MRNTIREYTSDRAKELRKMNIPTIESDTGIKILWFDLISSNDVGRIYAGQHSHSFFELHLVFAGTVYYDCNGKVHEIKDKSAIIIPPNMPHVYIKFSNDVLKLSIAFSMNEKQSYINISNRPAKVFFFSDIVIDCVNHILKYSEHCDLFTPSIVCGRIFEIIHSALTSLQIDIPTNDTNNSDPRINVAKAFINNNRHHLISCEDVAKECCLSVKQLNRIFKNNTESTLYDYIVSSRLSYAKKLLSKNLYSVKEVGYMLGFHNESGFVSFFKRHCGISPGAFRKENEK